MVRKTSVVSDWDEITFDDEEVAKAAEEIRERTRQKPIGKTFGGFRVNNLVHDSIWTTLNADEANACLEELMEETRTARLPYSFEVPLRTEAPTTFTWDELNEPVYTTRQNRAVARPVPVTNRHTHYVNNVPMISWERYVDYRTLEPTMVIDYLGSYTTYSVTNGSNNISIGYEPLDALLTGGVSRGELTTVISQNPADPFERHRRRETYPHQHERLDRNAGGCYSGRASCTQPNQSNYFRRR